jgi:hypothetical protein
MEVVALDAVLGHPEVAALAGLPQRPLQGTHDPPTAERGQSGSHLEGDVARNAAVDLGASFVGDARMRALRSPGPGEGSAPAEERELIGLRHTP